MPGFYALNHPDAGPFVKIMANSADSPITTPNDRHGAFRFNSSVPQMTYAIKEQQGVRQWMGYTGSWGNKYFPEGSDINTCWRLDRWKGSGIYRREYQQYALKRLYGYTPILRNKSSGIASEFVLTGDSSGSAETGYRDTYCTRDMAFENRLLRNTGPDGSDYAEIANPGMPIPILEFKSGESQYLTCLELPAMMGEPLEFPSATVTPGQRAVDFNNATSLLVARPGYEAHTATGKQRILAPDRIPMLAVAAGQITIATGATYDVPLPFACGPHTYPEFHAVETGGQMSHPPVIGAYTSRAQVIRLQYSMPSSTVMRFSNTGNESLTVRYIIIADTNIAPTTGGEQCIRKGTDAQGRDFIQVKRPGSSDTEPNAADVMLDSRLPYLPIIAEGSIATADMTEGPTHQKYGEIAKTVNFANPDSTFWPFALFVWNSVAVSGLESNYYEPYSRIHLTYSFSSQWAGRQSRRSCVAVINDTSVKFHAAPNNPSYIVFGTAKNENPRFAGLRYYIIAIPKDLT